MTEHAIRERMKAQPGLGPVQAANQIKAQRKLARTKPSRRMPR